MNEDDIAEEIVIGIDENGSKTFLNTNQEVDVNQRLHKKNDTQIKSESKFPDQLFQNND